MLINTPQHLEISSQLDIVLNSTEFSRSERLRQLLAYLVSQYLVGNQRVSEVEIADQVFQQLLDGSTNTSIVRVNIKRLRERLAIYYARSGRNDKLVFGLTERGYKVLITKSLPPVSPVRELIYALAHFIHRISAIPYKNHCPICEAKACVEKRHLE